MRTDILKYLEDSNLRLRLARSTNSERIILKYTSSSSSVKLHLWDTDHKQPFV